MVSLKIKRIRKTLFVTFFVVQAIFIQAQNDTTYTGDITVTTQEQVNALSDTLAGKTIIEGNLTIGYADFGSSRSDITDLTPLRNMTHITGNLIIQQNGQLVHLNALTHLQTIGGNFYVQSNGKLTTLGDFPFLNSIGRYFRVQSNGKLTDLGDFPVLESIGQYFSVRDNVQLTTLGYFPILTSIGVETAYVPSLNNRTGNVSIVVEENPVLSDCYVLTEFLSSGTTAVSGDIYINNNANGCNSQNGIINTVYQGNITVRTQAEANALLDTLADKTIINGNLTIGYTSGSSRSDIDSLSFLRNIVRITETLIIQQNGQLVNLNDLTHLQTIGGGFSVSNNDSLTTFGDFPVLQTIGGSFYVRANDQLTTFGDFPVLQTIGGSFHLQRNSRLTDLGDFTALDSIGGSFYVRANDQLTTFGDFPVLQTIVGDFSVRLNFQLTTFGDFPALQSIGGYFRVFSNGGLTDLGDFPALQSIGGEFHVSYNDQLTTIGNFPALQSIGGEFHVSYNDQLTTIGNFPELQSIGGYFSVSSNDILTTLGDFPTLMSIGMGNNVHIPSLGAYGRKDNVSIVVENNFSLSDCYVLTEALSGEAHAVSGEIFINNNATDGGCNSQNGIINSIYTGDITVTTQVEVNALRDTLAGKTIINGNLTIGYTSGSSRSDITDLVPLRNMTRITGNLIIQQNGQLVNLNDLTHLQTIVGYFSVSSNDILTSLGNFSTLLTSIGMDRAYVPSLGVDRNNVSMVVEENPNLSTCYVLTEFLSGGTHAVSGEIYINNNAVGCNSPSDININYINTIYGGDVTVTTQAEVNALRDTLASKTIIAGNLTIGYTTGSSRSDITDLTTLRNIVRITGDLRIGQNGQLVNLNDLTHLQTIGGYFQVFSNGGLTDLGDFSVLQSIGGNFVVYSNDQLTTLGDFPELQSIGGYFSVSNNDKLTDLGDFTNLQFIGKFFIVNNNDKLTTLGDFPNLQSIGGDFGVYANDQLTDLGDFTNLQFIGEFFSVSNNDKLTTLGDFPDLQTIGEIFIVNNNDKLTDLGDFPVLRTIGRGFSVSSNGKLTTLGDFSVLQTIGGSFNVYNNDKLTTLGDFPDLQTIGEFFIVENNDSLTTLGNFPVLTSIGIGSVNVPSLNNNYTRNVSMVVEENPVLSDCYYVLTDFLPGGTHAVSGEIYINNNANGCNSQNGIINTVYQGSITVRTQAEANALIDTLSGKTIINGNLTIGYTTGGSRSDIDSLSFLRNIVRITENLIIQQNGQLVHLNDLTHLQTIGGYFSVSSNDSLTDLGDNFPALLTSIGMGRAYVPSLRGDRSNVSIVVEENSSLSTCYVLTEFLSGRTHAVSGGVYINDNANGCNSQNDILNTIYGGDVTVTTQAEVNALLDTLSGKIIIEGNLTIGYTSGSSRSDITDLTPLRNMTHITGDIIIQRNGQLVNLNGLTHLQTIGGYFTVYNNDRLTDLGDFPELQSIGGYFYMYNNAQLTTLGDFSVLASIGGYFSVQNNARLTDLGDFPVLESIGGYFSVENNDRLTDLGDFSELQTIRSYFSVENNDRLTDLGDFPELQTIRSYFSVGNNGQLTDLGDFTNLQFIGEFFSVIFNRELTTLGDFSVLASIGGYFRVRSNSELTTLGDFPELQTIRSDFIIGGNAELTTLGDFPILQSVGHFSVYSNRELTTLGNFPDLQSIGGYFRVFRNAKLTALGDFPVLTNIGIGGTTVPSLNNRYTNNVSMVVEENPRLSDCYYVLTEFLPGGTHAVSGEIYINDNAIGCNSQNGILNTIYHGDITVRTQAEANALIDTLADKTIINGNLTIGYTSGSSRSDIDSLTPLRNMTRITGNLIIQRNGRLINLTDLNNLQTIGGVFSVSNNDSLTTFGNFPDLQTIRGGFNVQLNFQLTTLGDFPVLQTIGGFFHLQLNSRLTDLGDFPALQSIGGSFNVQLNFQLTTFGDFPALQSIGEYFSVYNNAQLTDLGDFPVLNSIGGYFDVYNNAQLTTLGDFPDLNSIGEYFTVYNNDRLTDLGDFPALQSIGEYFSVYNNAQLTDLGDFPVLNSIGEYFSVYNNAQLTSLGDFPILTSIGIGSARVPSLDGNRSNISMMVEENPRLSDCYYVLTDFLPGGTHAVSGGIYINDNAIGCNSQNGIINTVYQGSITIRTQAEANALLDTLSGKTIINGNLTIGYASGSSRSGITDLTPLSNIVRITRNLIIQQNGQLVHLNDLTHLQTIGGYFSVSSNDILTSLGNFPTLLTSIGMDRAYVPSLGVDRNNVSIVVEENPSLSTCYVLTEVLSGRTHAVSGGIYINDNANGCNSQNDILNTIYGGDVTVTTQAEVNALLDTLSGKIIIEGNLTIGYTTGSSRGDITDLTPLRNMTHITGDIIIQRNGQLVNLNGLTHLQSIGGYFHMYNNAQLTTLGDFSVLASIGGYFRVSSNYRLTDLGDFPELQSIGGYFSVQNNARLTDLGDFPVLQTIGGYFHMYNSELTDLGDFPVLQTIGGYFRVNSNRELTDLGDFPELQSDLGDFPVLQTIGEYFSVYNNAQLTDLGDFPVLQTIGEYFSVYNNAQLTDLGDFPVLNSIGEYFSVYNNAQLTSLGDFPILTSIGIGSARVPSLDGGRSNISIVVEENPRLSDCYYVLTEFLPGGTHAVSGEIYINDNAIGCNSQNGIINTVYQGSITIRTQAEANALLDTLSGKTIINGNLTIGYASGSSRSGITDLTPLSNIVRITRNLIIQQNGQLVHLNDLTHLQTIGGYFSVSSNDILTSLGNFPTLLTSIGMDRGYVPSLGVDRNNVSIVVEENPSLSTCYVLTEFLSGGTHAVSGGIYINDNANGCNSQNDILNTIYGGDVTVTTQAEANALLDTLSGKTIINGNLTIGYASGSSRSGITDLTPLSNIVRITGNLIIQQNGQLVNLTDLTHLQTIGGYFYMYNNAQLTTLGDFSVLASIGGYFRVSSNDRLTDLGDFPELQSIGGFFNISSCFTIHWGIF